MKTDPRRKPLLLLPPLQDQYNAALHLYYIGKLSCPQELKPKTHQKKKERERDKDVGGGWGECGYNIVSVVSVGKQPVQV